MKKYRISETETGSYPDHYRTVSVCLDDGKEEKTLTLIEHNEEISFCLCEKGVCESISGFDGLEFGGTYGELIKLLEEKNDSSSASVLWYLVYLSLCDEENKKKLIEETKDRYIEDIEIPMEELKGFLQ